VMSCHWCGLFCAVAYHVWSLRHHALSFVCVCRALVIL